MLLIGKGLVFLRDENQTMIPDGGVVCDGNEIVAVGPFDELKAKYPQAEHVDARGNLIMPGFINAHHHIYSAFSRGLTLRGYNPTGFLEILEGQWWRIDRTLNVRDSQMEAAAVYLSCIKNGVTTIFDHHASYGETTGSLFAIGEEARRFGVRSCLCYEITDRNGEAAMKEAVAENLSFEKYARQFPDELVGLVGLHASFTLSEKTMEYIVSQNTDNVGYHVHVAEGILDEQDSVEKYGVRVAERWNRWGVLSPKSLAGHCIHIDDNEREIIASSGVGVVHNPESNMGNAVGAPNVLALMKAGIVTGLGTDGFTSDMLESLKFANLLIKHREKDATVGFGEAMDMLFANNPKLAMRHFPKKVGVLEPGAYADVIVMEYDCIAPIDGSNLNGHLTFGMNGMNVVTTVSNGVLRMKDRVVLGIDEEKLVSEIRNQAADFARRVNA